MSQSQTGGKGWERKKVETLMESECRCRIERSMGRMSVHAEVEKVRSKHLVERHVFNIYNRKLIEHDFSQTNRHCDWRG